MQSEQLDPDHELKSPLCQLPLGDTGSLCLSVPICKMGTDTVLTSQDYNGEYTDEHCKGWRTVFDIISTMCLLNNILFFNRAKAAYFPGILLLNLPMSYFGIKHMLGFVFLNSGTRT